MLMKMEKSQERSTLDKENKENVITEDRGDSLDEPDGFFLSRHGCYKPREIEECECPTIGDKQKDDVDLHDSIYRLLKTTSGRWRERLLFLLKECKDEECTRKTLHFVHTNAISGIKAISDESLEGLVNIDSNSAPEGLRCADWMSIMDGLNFELTSPGTLRNIDSVDVCIGKNTKSETLEGFCSVVKCLLDLTWTNLKAILNIETRNGELLYYSVTALCSGRGIDSDVKPNLETIQSDKPSLMSSLGFHISSSDKLQWQKPATVEVFDKLCVVLHGLYRPADNLQTTV